MMTMVIAGCGSSPRSHPITTDGGADGPDSGDGPAVGSEGGLPPCFDPSDCAGGLTCCLRFETSSSGTVSCQLIATCPGDGLSTFIACATSDDCPPGMSVCTQITSVQNRPFNICSAP